MSGLSRLHTQPRTDFLYRVRSSFSDSRYSRLRCATAERSDMAPTVYRRARGAGHAGGSSHGSVGQVVASLARMPTALITGITGQDGRFLAELLHAKGYTIYGMLKGQNNPQADLIKREHPYVEIVHGDLCDLSSLIGVLVTTEPDEVYNLAAISFVAMSFNQAELTANVTGTGVLAAARGDPNRGWAATIQSASIRPARPRCSARCASTPQNRVDAVLSTVAVRVRQGLRT